MASMEKRMKAIEEEIAELKAQVSDSIPPKKPWWKEIAGMFAGDPDFLEAMRLGREYRESLRPKPKLRRKRRNGRT